MQLSVEAINEFKKLSMEEYGIRLTDQQAQEYSSRLIQFVKAIYGDTLPKTENKALTTVNRK